MKKIKDYKLPYSLTEEESKDKEKVKETFIKNMDSSKELRMDIWEKLYGRKYFRKDNNSIQEAEDEWHTLTEDKKREWFDFVCDKDMSFIQELIFITNLLKMNKGNVVKVTRDFRKYLKSKNGKE
jgi:hypothetical protein